MTTEVIEEVKPTITELAKQLDSAVNEKFAEYQELHKELQPYTNRQLEDKEVDEVNKVLHSIQNAYSEMHPALHLYVYRNQFAVNATTEYQAFVENLKKAGAKEAPKA